MKVVFVHDHKFRKIANEIYSPGGLSNEVLSRYVDVFGDVSVIGRVLVEEKAQSTYSKIVNPRVNINTADSLLSKIKEADAVIARLPSINGYKAIYYARKFRKPYLVEVVGCTKDAYLNYGLKGKIFAYPAYFLMKRCVENSKYTLYVTKEFLEKRYPCMGKTIAVSDVALEDVTEINIDKKYSENRDKIILGTLASVEVRYKGQEYVIKAIPLLEKLIGKKVEYQLVGSGNSEYLVKVAKGLGVENNVVVKGTLPHSEVFSWLDSIDVYIQPSLLEGLSRALVEAMSRGNLCVASKRGGNPELLEEKALVDFDDLNAVPQKIAEKIADIYKNNEVISQAKRNFKEAKENYNKAYLDKIRKDFYYDFKNYVIENKK